jgi:hypothetical protein
MTGKIRASILVAVAAATVASAQQPTMVRLGYSKLNPGAMAEYEALSKLVSGAYKKAGVPFREVWTTGVAGEMMMVSVSPVESLAQFDGPSPVMSQLSPEERVRYSQLARSAIRESRFVLAQLVPELSIISESDQMMPLVRVSNIVVKPGKNPEFETLVKTMLLPAWKKAGLKQVHVLRNITGASIGGYSLVSFAKNYAEVESWGSTEKLLSPELYHRFLESVGSTVESAENMFARLLPDLGYSAQRTNAKGPAKSTDSEAAKALVAAEGLGAEEASAAELRVIEP